MKIVLVHNSYQLPGGEDVVFESERSLLQKAGHEVISYCRSNFEVDNYPGVRKVQLAAQTVWSGQTKREFGELLRLHRPDVVHVHNTLAVISPAVYAACWEHKVPVVQTLHNYRLICPAATLFRDGHACRECVDHSLLRGVWHGCYRGSRTATGVVAAMLKTHRWAGTWNDKIDTYITLTEWSRREFIRGGLPAKKIVVKPNFVEVDPGEHNGKLGSYALFVGRLTKEKGLRTLLAAWESLPRTIPLYLAGEGPLRAELQQRSERAGLTGVHFLGSQSHAKVQELMRGARLVVFPSEWPEQFGLVAIEAFACSIPVLASNVRSLADIVSPDKTGFIFRSADPSDLAEKVLFAWHNPDYMRTLGQNARAEYLEKYTAKKNLSMLVEIYERAIDSRASGCPDDTDSISGSEEHGYCERAKDSGGVIVQFPTPDAAEEEAS
jgi:glycosyltransferase involved in cell wall biosynthesis